MSNLKEQALAYHANGKPGKIEVIPTKPHSTQTDLGLAYTPGVAEPCREIEKDNNKAYDYTAKGNLVAVISNGTAVLGLGDIGAVAGKPVMEGKGLLFKIYAGVDVFDIEVNEKDPKKFCDIVKGIAPTFGGINLEDIKAPECLEIEETLKKELNIPVMHDDQHGTAIISSAALINALDVAGKKIDEIHAVVNGAGAAAIACTNLYVSLGIKRENIVMLDSKGVIRKDREKLTPQKAVYATDRDIHTLEEARRPLPRPFQAEHPHEGNASVHGEEPDRVCTRQPGSGSLLRCRHFFSRRHHLCNGPFRLSEPGEQRDRFPVHLPRCSRRPRNGNQRPHEARCCSRYR